MAEIIIRFNKKFGGTICCILLVALLFSITVTTTASTHGQYNHGIANDYMLAASVPLESEKPDTPTEALVLPDYLVPRSDGFILPSAEELARYATIPVPEDIKTDDDITAGGRPVGIPESGAVNDSYFADALFVGDSRTVGLMSYSGVQSCYYAKVSLNIFSVLHTEFITLPGSDSMVTVLGAIEKNPVFKKVYISFGINELGYNSASFINAYEYFLDRVMALLPNAEVYIQNVFSVTAAASAKNQYGVNNDAINKTNELLAELARKKGVSYLNLYEQFAGADGTLDTSLTSDGIHLNKAGVAQQMQYIRTHTVN